MPEQPRYQQIADLLREEIQSGRLAPGAKLPSEAQLVERFGVSRDTVRDSTKLLIQAGLVEQRGLGRSGGMWVITPRILTFHASYAEEPGAPQAEGTYADSWASDVRAQGFVPSQDFSCAEVSLPDEIAGNLGQPAGSVGVLRHCIRYIGSGDQRVPASIQDTYYPAWLADEVPELRSSTDLAQGTTRLLADRGHVQVGYLDDVRSRPPTPAEATLLQLRPGPHVLVKSRIGATANRVLRVTIEVMVAATNSIEYEIGDVTAIRKLARS